jgi:hypothetical protein
VTSATLKMLIPTTASSPPASTATPSPTGLANHDALDALIVGISSKKVNFILDADIRSFFTEVSQQWVVRFLERRIGDARILLDIFAIAKFGLRFSSER